MKKQTVVRILSLFVLFGMCFGLFIDTGKASALTAEAQTEMDGILSKITGAKEFTVNRPVDNGIVLDMKDFGLSESNTPEANETAFANAIAKVKSTKAWKLSIPKGTYAVALTGKEAINLSNLSNFLLEGNGSTLIFSVGSTLNNTPNYITMNNSKTIAIQNLALDWDRSIYPIYGIGKVAAVNKTAGTVDFTFSDITVPDNAIFGGGRSWDPATNNRSETVGFQFPGGSSGISSMTKLASNKVRLTYKNAANVSSAVVGQYGQFWFRPKELVNGFRMQTNAHITFDNLHLYTVPYQAIFSNDSEYFQIINSSVEPAPGTKERFSAYGGVEIHSVDGYFRMENCHLEGINDDNIHLSNHFFGGGVSGNPKIDNYTVALDHLAHWMHYTEVYEGATFGMRDANFNDLGWSSKVVSFTWENYFTNDGNAPWRCTVKFADPLPSDYVSTNQFWNMDKNTGNYIIRNNTFEGGLAHAMYLGLANGTVENNTVNNFAYPGLILNCLIRWDRWAIGTPIQNVIIRNNTLKDCNKALRDPAAMFVGGGIDEQPSNYSPVTGRIASYVLVEGNTVESTPWAAFGTFSSKYLVIRNNQFINASTTTKKTGKPGGNVFITNADHVVFTGNTIYHGAVSYETGINVQSSTTSSIYSQNNSVQKYVKNNGVYGDIIVDTNTYGFEKVVGSWSNSSYAGYSGTVIGSSSTGAQIRWRPLLRRGHYTVYIYKMVVGANESADEATQIEVKHKNGTYTTTMNCHSGTKGFVKLGTFEFDEGNVGYVQATRSSSTLRVSAVKFVREDECTHGAKESVVKATCTDKGYTQRACTTCGYAYKQDYTAALGHNYKYTNAGAKHNITCSRCTYSSTGKHSYTNKVCKCGIKDTSHNLYFDFKNTVADQARYTLAVYGGYNFDQATSPYWATGANGGSSNMTVNNSAGTLTVKVIQDADSAGNYGPYIETTNTSGKYPWSGESYRVYYPLNYDPSNAEYLQVRFKLTNCMGATNPRIIVCFDTQTGDTYKSYENITTTIDGASTAYQLVSIPLTDTFRSVDYIKSLGFRFRDVKAASSSGGSVVIDYIFVGKRTEMPNPLYLVTFKNADGSTLGTATVSKGGTVTYSGATPTKAADGTNHYTFKGWDKALTNITADTTITATYTATAHSYTYSKVDGTNHKCSCSCGYSKNVAHTWNTGAITTQPTCTATGVKTYTCTACNATKTESVAAKGHTEVKDAAVAATCTTAGKTEGSHCSVCNAVIKAQTTVAATGHSYTYKATKNPTTSATGTLTGTCSKCSGTTTVTLPKLNTTDYTKTVTKAPTCTETGTDTYKWKTTTYGSFSFTATTAAKGHTEVKDAAVAATCTTAGKTEGSHCSVCNAVIKAQTTVAATGHSYTYKATKNPTTSATGTLTGTCSKCSDTTTVALPKLNTTDYTKTVTKAATCTATGTDTYKWNTTTYGTFSFTANTNALGHSYTAKVTAPTCTAQGYTTHTCSRCSDSYKDTYTNATGHSYTYKATKNPTTSATGTLTGTCSKCSGTTTVSLPKLNTTDYTKTVTKAATCTATGTDTYKWNTTTYGTFSFTATTNALGHSYTAKVTAPTCTAQGYTTHTCSRCSDSYKDTYTNATGHSYTSKVTTAATCTKAGVKTFTCSKCSHSYTDTIAATGHTEVIDKAVAATCTTAGKTEGSHCSVCNAVIRAQTTVPATGHSYTSKVTTAATCTKEGVKTFTCSKCSHSYTEAIAATGHTEVKDAAVAATCTTAGKTEGSHCSVCNAVIKAQTTVAATGHSYTYKATKNPTTSATGTLTGTCSKCSGTTTVTLPKLNTTDYTKTVTKAPTCTATGTDTYKWKTTTYGTFSFTATTAALGHSYTAKVTAPTCTAQGYTTHTCSRCSDSYKDTYTNATGHSYTSKITTAATCTKDGVKTFTCSKCNHSYTEAVAATGHTEVIDKAVAATCTKAGKTEGSHCSVCNAVIKAQTTVPATGHSYTSKVTTAATCTKAGVKTYTCSKCSHSYTEAIAATGHTEVVDKAVAATCTTAGKTEGSHCSVCNTVIKAQTTVPATGHSYSSKVTTAATCTKAGVKTYTCSKCNHSYTEAIAATGHTPVTDKAVAATCTTTGKTEGSHCSVCNAIIKAQTTVPATGHSYTSKVTTAATCTKEGVKTFTCSKCNHSYTEAIAATGHTEVIDKAIAATCTTAGKTEGSHCSVCNAVIKAQTTVPATGHSYTSKVTTAATCTKNGVKSFTCSKCTHSYTEAIAATGHTEVIDKAVAATCTTAGKTEGSHCSVCNAVIKAQTTVPATGHSYSYKSNGDGTHTVTCARCNDSYTENHNFGNGTCACGDVEITLDESIKILHTLDLASDISVTFAVQKTALASYESYYLECVLPEYNGNTLVGTSTVEVQPVVSGNYYYFTLTGITAVRMGDMVDAVLHMTKGGQEYISKTDSYSVATYAYGMLNSSKDTKMLTLCADLLRYGAEAQAFKGYRTDALVDADMTEVHRSYLSNTDTLSFTATDSYLGDLANPTITWVGKTLDLGSKVGMKFVFNAKNYTGDIANLSMKVTYQGSTGETKSVTVTGIEAYNANNKQYSFTFYGLLASELRTIVDVAIYEGNTQLSETLRYSAESYAAKTGTTALAALAKALFAYSDSAKAYFNK